MFGSKWYKIYFLLAGFDLLTIVLSLTLNHNLLMIHTATVQENREWANRLQLISGASNDALAINVAANDVFATDDVATARQSIDIAHFRFRQKIETLRGNIEQDLSPDAVGVFLDDLDNAEKGMDDQLDVANRMFRLFQDGLPVEASRTMAEMDRYNARIGAALVRAREEAESIQEASFQAHERTADRLRLMEYALFVLVTVAVCGAAIYGTRLARTASEAYRIVEDQRLEERGRAQRMTEVAQLATGVAHELRNPLTSVKLLVQTGLEEGISDDELTIVSNQVNRMERSLSAFLNFARPPKLEKRRFDLRKLVIETVQLIRARAEQQDIHIEVEGPSTLPCVADTDQIQQLLLNLCQNALDVMPHGGRLRIAIRAETDNAISMSVCDTGPGLEPAIRRKLFQPFVSSKETGVGLGLVISRQIARSHGGELILCNRDDEREGACFRATLVNGDRSETSS